MKKNNMTVVAGAIFCNYLIMSDIIYQRISNLYLKLFNSILMQINFSLILFKNADLFLWVLLF
jgi:hypothetical protein